MACNGILTPNPPNNITNRSPKLVTPPVFKFLTPSPSPQTFYSPLRLEMADSAFFTHGYFHQVHRHISEALITD